MLTNGFIALTLFAQGVLQQLENLTPVPKPKPRPTAVQPTPVAAPRPKPKPKPVEEEITILPALSDQELLKASREEYKKLARQKNIPVTKPRLQEIIASLEQRVADIADPEVKEKTANLIGIIKSYIGDIQEPQAE